MDASATDLMADRAEVRSPKSVRAVLPAGVHAAGIWRPLALVTVAAMLHVGAVIAMWTTGNWLVRTVLAIYDGLALIPALFIFGHDANHGAFTASPRLNRVLGRLAFLPALQPTRMWIYGHNGLHHGWTNLRGMDLVFAPLTKPEFDSLPKWRQWTHRLYRHPLGIGALYFFDLYLPYTFTKKARHPGSRLKYVTDRLWVQAYLVGQIGVGFLVAIGRGQSPARALAVSVFAMLLPFVLWNYSAAFVTFQQHTHPLVPWFDQKEEWSFFQGEVRATTHIRYPKLLAGGMFNINVHTAHHVDPRIPLFNLPTGQTALENAYGSDVPVIAWTIGSFLDTMRRCKLYDYRSHQWIDFDGNPTSEPSTRFTSVMGEATESSITVSIR